MSEARLDCLIINNSLVQTNVDMTGVEAFVADLQTIVRVAGKRPRMEITYLFHDADVSGVRIGGPIKGYFGHLASSFDGTERVPLLERLISVQDKPLFEMRPEEMIEEMKMRGARGYEGGQHAYMISGNPRRSWEATFNPGERHALSVPTTVPGVQYRFTADRIDHGVQFQETLHIRGLFVPR